MASLIRFPGILLLAASMACTLDLRPTDGGTLEESTDAGTVETTDGGVTACVIDPLAGEGFQRIIRVPWRTSELDSGARLSDALSGIHDAASNNRYVVLIEPGVYDLGAADVVIQSFVQLRGTGEQHSTVRSSRAGQVVQLHDRAELRDLRIENSGDGSEGPPMAAYCQSNPAHVSIRGVALAVPKASHVAGANVTVFQCHGFAGELSSSFISATVGGAAEVRGFESSGATGTVKNTRVILSGGSHAFGIGAVGGTYDDVEVAVTGASWSEGISLTGNGVIRNARITADSIGPTSGSPAYAVSVGDAVSITHSELTGRSAAIRAAYGRVEVLFSRLHSPESTVLALPGVTVTIANSQLAGGPVTNQGATELRCEFVTDEQLLPATGCP